MNFVPEIEKQPLEIIKKFQEEKLRQALEYANEKSKYYQSIFQKEKINVKKIKTLEDLRYIPFTRKEDLQLNNQDFICVEKSKIVDYITTSGTLSTPTTFALTDKDLDRLAYNEAISFTCAIPSTKQVLGRLYLGSQRSASHACRFSFAVAGLL